MERRVGSRGYYPFRATAEQLAEFEADPAKVDVFFHAQMNRVLEQWMALADERLEGSGRKCYVCPGNDDGFDSDDVIRRSKHVRLAEGVAVDLGDGFSMVSTGWSNVTPWKTYRELPEAELSAKIEAMIPVGSKAVREAIMRHQPLLSLHGHIHEGKGTARLGKTLCINAGSLYEQGVLQGVIAELDPKKGIKSYTLTTG